MTYLLATILLIAGIVHCVTPGVYLNAMPPYLSHPIFLIYFTGICELAAAGGLCVARLRRATGWCLTIFFIAIFPVHIYMVQHSIPFFGTNNAAVLWGRLLFQGVFVYWALRIALSKSR